MSASVASSASSSILSMSSVDSVVVGLRLVIFRQLGHGAGKDDPLVAERTGDEEQGVADLREIADAVKGCGVEFDDVGRIFRQGADGVAELFDRFAAQGEAKLRMGLAQVQAR